MAEAFLDSTTLIELVFRHWEARARVEAGLPTGERRLTSRYVLFEIARGYLCSLLILYNKSLEVQSLRELHEYMHTGQQLFKKYRRETMLGGYDDFLAHLETLGISMNEAQRLAHFRGWLAQHLRRGWRQLSRAVQVVNPVGCREDIPSPAPKTNGRYEQRLPTSECGRPEACGLDAYLSRSRTQFQAVADGLAALENRDTETERRIAALRRLLARANRSPFQGQDCWSCGDAIICHEAQTDQTVFSKNRKHFEPLCAILSRTLVVYS